VSLSTARSCTRNTLARRRRHAQWAALKHGPGRCFQRTERVPPPMSGAHQLCSQRPAGVRRRGPSYTNNANVARHGIVAPCAPHCVPCCGQAPPPLRWYAGRASSSGFRLMPWSSSPRCGCFPRAASECRSGGRPATSGPRRYYLHNGKLSFSTVTSAFRGSVIVHDQVAHEWHPVCVMENLAWLSHRRRYRSCMRPL
jgi:hypothetical protein